MTRARAMQAVTNILQQDFKYLYEKENTDIHTVHLTFQMDSRSHCLQMSFDFQERWCDILCFISPTVLTVGSENYWEALKTVNFINWNIKSWGRFYVDDFGDIAYSLRIYYDALEKTPQMCAKEIECAVDFWSDLFIPLLNVCQGKASFAETKRFIEAMWVTEVK